MTGSPKVWPNYCAWLIEAGTGWEVCRLPVAGRSLYGDEAPLCKKHLANEGVAVSGKPVKAGR